MFGLGRRREQGESLKVAVSQFLATGGASGQIAVLEQVLENMELSPTERNFFEVEVLPMARVLFLVAQSARVRFFRYTEADNWANVGTAILAAVSAVPVLPDQYKFVPLLIIAVAGAVQGGLKSTLIRCQPEVDWLSSRKAYDRLLSISIERLTSTGEYANLEEPQKLQVFARKVAIILDEVEATIQAKINTFITMSTTEKCKPDDGES